MRSRGFLLFSCFLSGCCPCADLNTCFGKFPASQRAQWTPPDPCNYGTFPPKPGDILAIQGKVDLPYLLDYALCHNPSTEQSWSLAKASYFAYQASKGALYPSLTANVTETLEANTASKASSISTQNSSLTGTAGFFLNNSQLTDLNLDLTINWLLLDFGGRCATIEAAKYALINANWTHNQTVQTVMYQVISTYYAAVGAIETRKASEYSLADAKKSLAAAETQFAAGVVTKLDVLQAKSNYAQAEYNLVQAVANEEIALANLAQASGLPPNICLEICLVEEIDQKEITTCLDQMVEIAKGSRNDVAAYFATYQQMAAEEKVAYSNMLPQFAFIGDLSKTYFSSGFGTVTNVSAAVGMTWNFFNGYENEYLYYQSKCNTKAAYASWKVQEQQAILQVVTAYNQYEAADENLYYADEFYMYSKEAFDAALLGYRAGVNTILDVLSTESSLASARTQLVQARTNYMTALANISYSTGMLFEGGYEPCQTCCD